MISDWTEVAETFDAMGLHENLLRGIYAYGAPSPSWPPPASDTGRVVRATAARSRAPHVARGHRTVGRGAFAVASVS